MRMKKLLLSGAMATLLAACGAETSTSEVVTSASTTQTEDIKISAVKQDRAPVDYFKFDTAELPKGNSVLASWDGPYQGVPAFDTVSLADLEPALNWGMERMLSEVDQITSNPEAPTFENTIVPLEKAGEDIGRAYTYWGIWSSNRSSDEFRAIQGKMVPKFLKTKRCFSASRPFTMTKLL